MQIMADESLLDYGSAEKLLEEQICNHFNLKISKLGGVFLSQDIYQLTESRGIPCQLGAHFGKTSILTSAGALLGGMTGGQFSACEGALGELLLSEGIALPAIQHKLGGQLPLSEFWQKPVWWMRFLRSGCLGLRYNSGCFPKIYIGHSKAKVFSIS